MNDQLIIEAKQILGTNKTDKASRDLMSNEQRHALSNDYASRKQFLSAAHFHPDLDKRTELELMFWENMKGTKL